MSARHDHGDRVALALIGSVLLAAGVLGLLHSYDVVGDDPDGRPFLVESVRTFVADHEDWFWPVVAVLLAAVTLLALRWLSAQLPVRPSTRPLRVDGGSPSGRTELSASSVTDVVRRDLEATTPVQEARVRVDEWNAEAVLDLRLTVGDDVDVAALRQDVVDPALERAQQALDVPELRARVETVLAPPRRNVD